MRAAPPIIFTLLAGGAGIKGVGLRSLPAKDQWGKPGFSRFSLTATRLLLLSV